MSPRHFRTRMNDRDTHILSLGNTLRPAIALLKHIKPRANRLFIPDQIWHITHRCHRRDFLLKFARDRRRWRHWLFQARKRFGLCLLNYIATSNHAHLRVKDQGRGENSNSMQPGGRTLVASRDAVAL